MPHAAVGRLLDGAFLVPQYSRSSILHVCLNITRRGAG